MTLLGCLQRDWPVDKWADTTSIVAVSGGADSVALLLALHSLKTPESGDGRLIVAHFNHRLRGQESDADESFVLELATRLNLQCESQRISAEPTPINATGSGSVRMSEDAARSARYDFLKRVALRTGARYLATAHTADDQAETILLRILRGTGIDGLAGIPRVRELTPGITLIRPLLSVRRQEILEYLRQRGQPYREDSSNAALHYTRNRLRRELLPQMERDFNPQVRQALCRLGALAGEVNLLVKSRVDALLAMLRIAKGEPCVLDCDALLSVESHVVRQLFITIWQQQQWPMRDMTFEHWNQLADIAQDPHAFPAKIVLPGEIAAERAGQQLTISPPVTPSPGTNL